LEDLRDDMDDMMAETDYMNEMLNRNYGLDVDEAELDEEFANLDNEIFKE
jgi:charged multivesicular body protein 5